MTHPIDTALIQLLMSIEIYKSINMTPPVQEIIIDLAREHRVNSLDLKWSYHDYKAGLITLPNYTPTNGATNE
jgi:hypothetical protein